MFNQIRYVPYKQTAFTSTEAGINVSSPWLSLDVDVEINHKSSIEQLVACVQSGNGLTDAETQNFLGFFAGYPLLHAEPRTLAAGGTASVYASDAEVLMRAAGPRQFLAAINPFAEVDVAEAFAYFPDVWEWSADEIAAASHIPGSDSLFDPLSVYTAIRAKRLEFQIENAEYAHKLLRDLETLRQSDEAHFFRILVILLSQQYYVTRECCSCLDPAIDYLLPIQNEIRAYKDEEGYHDRLILKSIRELTDQPTSELIFAPEVKLEIEVIKYAAQTCALGFSALVSIMEGTVYPESDPVGDVLKKSSKPSAHIGVEAHFQINKRGNHTAIPESFVKKLPPVTMQTVAIATRLAEVTIRLDSGLARTMLKHM
jgi:hypothetical protein